MIRSRDSAAEEHDEAALCGALRAPGLSPSALNRVRRALNDEWQQIYGVAPARRVRTRLLPFAALLVAIAAVGMFLSVNVAPVPVVATVANGLSGSLRASGVGTSPRSLSAGAPLHRGDRIEAVGAGELRWLRGGVVRLKPGARITVVNDTDLRLDAGALFVDLAAPHQDVALRVLTPYATVEHVGTQFVVSLDGGALAVGVREGEVRVIGAATTRLDAGDELQLDRSGTLRQRRLTVDDPAWSWVGEPLFAFDPDGRTVLELLQWVSQEKGRPLQFADERVRARAEATVLHGSIRGLGVDPAMDLMLATTSLQAVVLDERIDVLATSATRTAPAR